MNRFFFVTSYDNLSGSLIGSLLNQHPDIQCHVSFPDPFLMKQNALKIPEQTVDEYVGSHQGDSNKFYGNVQLYSAFELQYKILTQRTHSPLFRANITVTPQLRIQLLQKSWIDHFGSTKAAVSYIENLLHEKTLCKLPLFNLMYFNYFHSQVVQAALTNGIDLSSAESRLFILALAKAICHDTADLPTPCQSFKLEDIANDMNLVVDFMQFLSGHKIRLDDAAKAKIACTQLSIQTIIKKIEALPFAEWQTQLIDFFITTKLQTIYHPHIDKPLVSFYTDHGYQFSTNYPEKKVAYSKLLSIHLNSNRPSQLLNYFDNIESTCDHPEDIEIVVNIDDDDKIMEQMLREQILTRRFTLKYTTSPKPDSFCDLWKPINKLLPLTDPNAYFLLNISDEMLFATYGWDTILKKYVGFFPDNIFRLRASRNKFRNYFDRWECSFAQDSIPITTKRWIDIGGDWNPCFGPDSYQQLIAFYLAQEGAFSNNQYLRELPLLDIKFHGDVPAIGIEPHKQWKHSRDHVFAMQICQSYPMQLEARRRAVKMRATIIAEAKNIKHYNLADDTKRKRIYLINADTNKTEQSFSYKLSKINVKLTNNWRKLRYFGYFGEGRDYKRAPFMGYMQYLKSKYHFALRLFKIRNKLYALTAKIMRNLKPEKMIPIIKTLIKTRGRDVALYLRNRFRSNSLQEEHQLLKKACHELQRENEKLYHLLVQLNVELPQQLPVRKPIEHSFAKYD